MSRAGGPVSSGDTAAAFAIAQVRYWLTVAPKVHSELRRWRHHAEAIADPTLRCCAADKLRDERANTQAIATLCTLAPRRHRRTLVVAAVALQVMYDYLDAVTEQDVDRPLRNSRQLFRSFAVALTPGEAPVDYYRYHPQPEDGGYLDTLVETARDALAKLPALAVVLPAARTAAARFAEAQARSHAVPREGVRQLEDWAKPSALAADLWWWEWAAGAAASILSMHVLLCTATDNRVTTTQIAALDDAYMLASTLTTMLDSLIDDDQDAAADAHRYISYYPAPDVAGCRLANLAWRSVVAARGLPRAAHHVMTIGGIAAFYLSSSKARTAAVHDLTAPTRDVLKPTITPALAVLALWRRVSGA
jgi:tetraprenyl-beta-curcumene synthase